MSDDTECVHGMEYGCSICNGKDVRRPEPEEAKFTYRAKYEGQCPECGLPIAVGQQCVKTTKIETFTRSVCHDRSEGESDIPSAHGRARAPRRRR
jgi:hypothetical protein